MSQKDFVILDDPDNSVFICYAHADNEGENSKHHWLDRFLEFVRPMIRQEELRIWSDEEIKIGFAEAQSEPGARPGRTVASAGHARHAARD